jgi:hypothetical protein
MSIEPEELDDDDLRNASRDEQIEAMKGWFYDRYEDPVHEMPYDSEEGGYLFMDAGPHDASEVLSERFDGVVPQDVIEEVSDNLDAVCSDWVRKSHLDDGYGDYLSGAIDADTHPLETLRGALAKTEALVDRLDDDYLRSLALVGVISALEAFLLDTFSGRVLGDKALLRRYVEGEPKFRARPLDLPWIFKRYDGLREEAQQHLSDMIWKKVGVVPAMHDSLREVVQQHLIGMIWHKIGKVAAMYKWTFKIEIPDGLDAIGPAVNKRHDIVHRGGKAPDGAPCTVSKDELSKLLGTVKKFATALNKAITPPDPPLETLGDFSDSPF